MKKKIFTLLTLLVCLCTGAWAANSVSATQSYSNSGRTCTWTSVSATVISTTPFGANGLLFKTAEGASNGIKMGDSNASLKVYELNDVIYIEVPSATSNGTITIKSNGGNSNRKLKTKSSAEGNIEMVAAGKTVDFTASDLTQIESKYYIELTYIAQESSGKEYKLLSSEPFSVTLNGETFPGYVADAASPIITTDLLNSGYDASVGIGLDLTIVAEHVTGYQWYSCDDNTGTNSVAISGATQSTYTYTAIAADAETTKYFYCIATNENATGTKTATSNIATVNVGALATLTAVTNQVWNIADFSNATYSTATIINNLEICNGTIDAGSKNIDGYTLAKRIKINKDEAATTRYIKFKVGGPCVITVYGMTGSSAKTRVLGIKVAGTEVATLSHSGSDMGKKTYTYTGTEEAEVILFCKEGDGTFNVHGIVVSDVAADISAYEWATFVSNKALAFDGIDGLEAYIVTGHNDHSIETSQITGTVAANTPLLLKGTANAKYYIPMAGTVSPVAGNLLKAGDGSAVSAEDSKTKYVLSVVGGKAGFKKIVSGSPATVAEGKAYLEFNEVISARDFLGFDDEATALTLVNSEKRTGNCDVYDLQGRKVAQTTKGLYIVNGRKVIVK